MPFSPVQSARKFSAVLGTTSERSSISMRPAGCRRARVRACKRTDYARCASALGAWQRLASRSIARLQRRALATRRPLRSRRLRAAGRAARATSLRIEQSRAARRRRRPAPLEQPPPPKRRRRSRSRCDTRAVAARRFLAPLSTRGASTCQRGVASCRNRRSSGRRSPRGARARGGSEKGRARRGRARPRRCAARRSCSEVPWSHVLHGLLLQSCSELL